MRLPIALTAALAAVITAVAVPSTGVKFTDITTASGIKFTHNAGKTGKKYLPETLGAGVAIFDADGDGWADILLINSKDWTPRGRRTLSALYRNNKNGTFTNITAGSGLDVEMYGLGVAAGDFDNDGKEDVYITALEGDHLFLHRNLFLRLTGRGHLNLNPFGYKYLGIHIRLHLRGILKGRHRSHQIDCRNRFRLNIR